MRPGWGAAALKAALLDGADRLPGLAGVSVSGGRLNAAATARIAAGLPPAPGPEPGPLGPELPALGEALAQDAAPARAAATPRIRGVRLRGRPRVCRHRRACEARTATLSFRLGAEAAVTVRLQRQACVRTRCRWRARPRAQPAAARPGARAGLVGRSLLGMRLRRGRWRVTLVTSADRAGRSVPRPLAAVPGRAGHDL